MNDRYTVRVTKDFLVFSSGHFITFNSGRCERLHGHNYRVAVELDGPLDVNHYVFDFIALKDRAQEIINELDHRMLVATKNPLLKVSESDDEVTIQYQQKRWVFPREDCAVLPVENTTAELLAQYLAYRLLSVLLNKHQYQPDRLRVEVEECIGQSARYEVDTSERLPPGRR